MLNINKDDITNMCIQNNKKKPFKLQSMIIKYKLLKAQLSGNKNPQTTQWTLSEDNTEWCTVLEEQFYLSKESHL